MRSEDDEWRDFVLGNRRDTVAAGDCQCVSQLAHFRGASLRWSRGASRGSFCHQFHPQGMMTLSQGFSAPLTGTGTRILKVVAVQEMIILPKRHTYLIVEGMIWKLK